MVDIYIKHTDNNFYKLDIDPAESINFKLTVKDLSDISKIFAPFTQPFKFKATDKNKILCGFIGNEKIQRLNNSGDFEAKIYIAGFLFQSGILSFNQADYEQKDQKVLEASFASTVTSLVDVLDDFTIQDVFDLSDPALKIKWSTVKPPGLPRYSISPFVSGLTSIQNRTLQNGVPLKFGIPFMSNYRTWVYDDLNPGKLDNIKFNQTRSNSVNNFINLAEVRPAVTYSTIMQSIIKTFNLNVTAPLFSRPEFTELFVWCSAESLQDKRSATTPLTDNSSLAYSRYDVQDDADSQPVPTDPKWLITENPTTGVFKIKRQSTPKPQKWSDGLDITLAFNGLTAIDNNTPKVRVVIRRTTDGSIIDSSDVGSSYTFRFKDSQLDSFGETYFQYEILPLTLCSWNYIVLKTIQYYDDSHTDHVLGVPINYANRAKFSATATNSVSSEALGGSSVNLITSLPKMKCIDFLKSFFKTFNISIVSTGLPDNSMYWLTPSDVLEVNKPYSQRDVDYTKYLDSGAFTKKKANEFNLYSFQHKDSKYFEAVYGDGTRFGNLNYPLVPPSKPTKYEIKTEYSVIKQSNTLGHPVIKTCLGFQQDGAKVLDTGSNRYVPVYDEFTLFYLKSKSLSPNTLGAEGTTTENYPVSSALEASFKNYTNGKTLAFGAENGDTDSLYSNYYSRFIELILNPNAYATEFMLNLPPNEIFLNFANTKQGESNIPTGFRAQNEIIISEQRYSLADSAIDLTTGKTKLTLINH